MIQFHGIQNLPVDEVGWTRPNAHAQAPPRTVFKPMDGLIVRCRCSAACWRASGCRRAPHAHNHAHGSRTGAHTQTARTHARSHTRRPHARAHPHPRTLARAHAHTQTTRKPTRMHARTHRQTTHTHLHIRTHTRTHTSMHTRALCGAAQRHRLHVVRPRILLALAHQVRVLRDTES